MASDYEQLLKRKNSLLYSLESYRLLKEFDLIAVTAGYELAFTNILAMLGLADIPLCSSDRREEYPIIIAEGPAVVNPLLGSSFFDAIYNR